MSMGNVNGNQQMPTQGNYPSNESNYSSGEGHNCPGKSGSAGGGAQSGHCPGKSGGAEGGQAAQGAQSPQGSSEKSGIEKLIEKLAEMLGMKPEELKNALESDGGKQSQAGATMSGLTETLQ